MADAEIGMVPLGQSDLALTQESDDVRGMTVLDASGHRVGDVDEIIVDEEERRARLLVVASGGFLGMGEEHRLVPVEAVTRIDEDVHLRHTDEVVRRGARYDPALVERPSYAEIYGHYGYTPFWRMGYTAPYFFER